MPMYVLKLENLPLQQKYICLRMAVHNMYSTLAACSFAFACALASALSFASALWAEICTSRKGVAPISVLIQRHVKSVHPDEFPTSPHWPSRGAPHARKEGHLVN